MARIFRSLGRGRDCRRRWLRLMRGGEIFVPKIPSMRMTDLARCIAPGCRFNFVGIRSGEKLHEEMVVEEDARQTIQLPDRFVIIPSHYFKVFEETMEWQTAGPCCPEGFRYGSDNNDRWLSGED